jgi:hypothetical protein
LVSVEALEGSLAKPRKRKLLEIRKHLKTPWDFNKSVFKDYKPDTEKLLNDAFDNDWACSKADKLIKNE